MNFLINSNSAINKRVLTITGISIGLGYFIYKHTNCSGEKCNFEWRKWIPAVSWPKMLTWKQSDDGDDGDDYRNLYEYQYINEFKDKVISEKSDDELHELVKTYLTEETPDGMVVMYYDHKEGKFCYYSDKVIQYKYLETVSRKYAIVHDCGQIYINIEDEMYNSKLKLIEEFKKDEEDAKNKNDKSGVFAKFKSYNSRMSKEKGKGKWLLLENSNNYIYKGKMDAYQKMINPPSEENPPKKITFADYKRSHMEK